MDDFLFKVGAVVIALLVVAFLINLTMDKTNFEPPSSYEVSIADDSTGSVAKIQRLCKKCSEEYFENDCYILRLDLTKGKINQSSFDGNVYLNFEILEGETILKIRNNNKLCVISRFNESETCDPDNGSCEENCNSFECDAACYSNISDGVCNRFCVDTTGDKIIDLNDKDGICDQDCNTGFEDKILDPDCWGLDDLICDPDQHMIIDTICDNDCQPQNRVCDPDCAADSDC